MIFSKRLWNVKGFVNRTFQPWAATILVVLSTAVLTPHRGIAAGVTIITHGFESDSSYPSWISYMADQVPDYGSFPGTNFTTYRIAVSYNAGYVIAWNRTNGIAPSATDSGEIIVELDWSQISGDVFDSYASTYSVAWPVTWALLQTNLIGELGGHALAEFPIHLIGHSRGGSLVSEVSRQLGTNGVWVDHLTTLDPYPLNNDGNSDFPATVVDAPVHTYSTVLFADNYWQDLGAGYILGDPDGEPVAGAYVRQLTNLSGGYNNDHSNVHLWYFGTVDSNTPASDGSASITASARQSWWVPYETNGLKAGFYYSLVGGGNRLSTDEPVGAGAPAIVDGYNQVWNFGAGTANNRTALSTNNGSWPNLMRFDRASTNLVLQGQSAPFTFYYQWGLTNAGSATVNFFIDDNSNPLNGNGRLLKQMTVPGTGASAVNYVGVNLPFDPTNATTGLHRLYAAITGNGHTRFLYAPQPVLVVGRPTLDIALAGATRVAIGVNGISGEVIILQTSSDLQNWLPLATNTLTSSRWVVTNSVPADAGQQFFRAWLSQ